MTIDADRLVATWRQMADPVLAADGQFRRASQQKLERGIDFCVRIVTVAGNHELQPVEQRLATFLSHYGFGADIDPGINVSALDGTYAEDADLIVVFPLSDDLEAFCLELAKEQSNASRMIVCVPSGNDGKVYCRLIREKYGVQTVTILSQDLVQGGVCRFGVDVAKHCANYMMKKVAETNRQLRLKNSIVILIHGIRTRALWQGDVRQALESAGLVAIPTNYKKLDVVRFLLPFRWAKSKSIRRVENDVRSVRKRFPDADIAILAHSFGTFITGQLLKNDEHKFGRIALCGSVLPIDYDFASAENRFSEIINEVGCRDIWPAIAAKFGWGYGPTGSFGFNRPFVRDRRHALYSHSSFLNASFCNIFWIPYFSDGNLDNTGDAGATPSIWVRIVDSIPLVKWILWGAPLVFALYFAFQLVFT